MLPDDSQRFSDSDALLAYCYTQYQQQIRTHIAATIDNPSDVEDLVQQVLVAAWEHAARFDASKGDLGAWLGGITRHTVLDFLRRIYRRPMGSAYRKAEDIAWTDCSALADLIETEQAEFLAILIARLPTPASTVVHAAFFLSMTHQQIAEQWQIPLGTVKTIIRRSLGQLRVRIESDNARD